jgi:hypothetical protein
VSRSIERYATARQCIRYAQTKSHRCQRRAVSLSFTRSSIMQTGWNIHCWGWNMVIRRCGPRELESCFVWATAASDYTITAVVYINHSLARAQKIACQWHTRKHGRDTSCESALLLCSGSGASLIMLLCQSSAVFWSVIWWDNLLMCSLPCHLFAD